VYTIGLHESLGAELVLPGAIIYAGDECMVIVHSIREQLAARIKQGAQVGDAANELYTIDGLGSFTLRRAHESWARQLLLGAFDYYRPDNVTAYQIVPDSDHHTVDVPDMRSEWSAASEPVWRWLSEPWPYSFPEDANVTTNLAALRGKRVTEVSRWDDGWEMFAGPGNEVTQRDMRVVPISCLVGPDPSLAPALELAVDAGIWREPDGSWQEWKKAAKPAVLPKLSKFFKGTLTKRKS
jgi:hypothetical protein